jgi:hypothetical protein
VSGAERSYRDPKRAFVAWQRCQFHLAANAIHHAPNVAIRGRIGAEVRNVWNASTLVRAQSALDELVAAYHDTAPALAKWLENTIPEGLAVFTLPEHHRRRLRTLSSAPSSRSSSAGRSRSGCSPTTRLSCASSPPFSSRSTKHGPLTARPTSSGNAEMPELGRGKFPDVRLHNQEYTVEEPA